MRAFSDLCKHRKTIHLWQHHIQHDAIISDGGRLLQSRSARLTSSHVMSHEFEIFAGGVSEFLVVFDEENVCHDSEYL